MYAFVVWLSLLGRWFDFEVIPSFYFIFIQAPPPVPPRTYLPQAPPSQLPALLQSLARTVGVLSAASGVALWIYHVCLPIFTLESWYWI